VDCAHVSVSGATFLYDACHRRRNRPQPTAIRRVKHGHDPCLCLPATSPATDRTLKLIPLAKKLQLPLINARSNDQISRGNMASSPSTSKSAGSPTDQPKSVSSLPPEAIALATRLFEGARQGNVALFEQVLAHQPGIKNMRNDKGDTLVSAPWGSPLLSPRLSLSQGMY
jgi:hypothetical protein